MKWLYRALAKICFLFRRRRLGYKLLVRSGRRFTLGWYFTTLRDELRKTGGRLYCTGRGRHRSHIVYFPADDLPFSQIYTPHTFVAKRLGLDNLRPLVSAEIYADIMDGHTSGYGRATQRSQLIWNVYRKLGMRLAPAQKDDILTV